MNVKNRTLLLVSLILIFLTGFYLYEGADHYNNELDIAVLEQEKLIDSITDDIKEYAFGQYHHKIKRFLNHHEGIRQAFAEQNREKLYELCSPILQEYRKENKFFHAIDFNLSDGTVFLRVQKPDLFGDNILESREIVSEVHKSRRQASGFDIGKHGAIFWVAEPVFHNNEYMGLVEFGIEARQLEEALARSLGSDVTSVLKAKEWQKAELIKEGFQDLGEYVLMTHGHTLFDQVAGQADLAHAHDQRVTLNGIECILHSCAYLPDYKGETIGRIIMFQDVSGQVEKKRQFILHAVLVSSILLALSFGILYYSFGLLVGRLEKSAGETREAKEELQSAHDELELRVEERTSELAQSNEALKDEISARKITELKLHEQGEFLGNIIESLTHPFYVIDAVSYAVVMANKAACEFLGGESYQGLTCYGLTHRAEQPCAGSEHPCPLQDVMKEKKPVSVVHVHYDHEGKSHIYEVHAYPIFDKNGNVSQIVEYNIEVTDRKKAEEEHDNLRAQLFASQKMEAVGILAGGVAHDFNNILTTVLGYSQIMILKLDEQNPMREMVQEIYDAAERAAGLTRQLLAFSRKQVMEMKVAGINDIIVNLSKMIRRLIGENIEIHFSLGESIGSVKVDVGQVEQVLMNLVINARDAMPGGGKLTIETREVLLDEQYAASHAEVKPGRYAMLSVMDTGEGMSKEVREKIFEPFFTTKTRDKGTGLGLATVFGIVKQHEGHIYVYSEPGRGSTFKIYFPVVGEDLAEKGVPGEFTDMAQGSELVMVVDDDPAIRRLVRDTLEPLGYSIIEAGSGEDALSLFKRTREKIHLVLSDLIMPGMNGQEMLEQIERDHPDVKVILMSGYTDNIIVDHGVLKPDVNFISKPLLPVTLTKRIREVLDRKK
ncbi:MAG: ATP-binding protein [Desulfobulbaceae bacterium]|nr:ATP-binding protein [Desulfobulbaceae bacterium]